MKDSAPDFDLDALINAVSETGIGICNLRFLANAAVAGCDKVPGRSTAMLTLVMFSAHPEKPGFADVLSEFSHFPHWLIHQKGGTIIFLKLELTLGDQQIEGSTSTRWP